MEKKKGRFSKISEITEDLRKEKLGHMSTEITKTEEKVEQPQVVQQTPIEVVKEQTHTVAPEIKITEEPEDNSRAIQANQNISEEKTDFGEKKEAENESVQVVNPSKPLEESKKIEKKEESAKQNRKERERKETVVDLTDTIRITPFHNQVLQILYKRNKHLYKRREDLLEEIINKALESDPVAQKVMKFIKEMGEN